MARGFKNDCIFYESTTCVLKFIIISVFEYNRIEYNHFRYLNILTRLLLYYIRDMPRLIERTNYISKFI